MRCGLFAALALLAYASLSTRTVTVTAAAHELPRGADPEDAAIYIPSATNTFLCGRMAQKYGISSAAAQAPQEIPYKNVNDGYCDCWDASDEPGTSACRDSYFYCANEPFVPSRVPSRFVNDGICHPDCCDGSKDYSPKSNCLNDCRQRQVELVKKLEESDKVRQEILKKFKNFEATSTASIEFKRKQIASMNEQYNKVVAENKVHQKRKACQNRLLEKKTSISSAKEELKKSAGDAVKTFLESNKDNDAVQKMLASIEKAAEVSSEDQIVECVGINLGLGWEALFNDIKLPFFKRLALAFNLLFNQYSLLRDFVTNEVTQHDVPAETISKRVKELSSEVHDLEKKLKVQVPSSEWYHLAGECFDWKDKWSKYTFCPFSRVERDGHVMGTWSRASVKSASEWVMTSDETCDKEPREMTRMATVKLECGSQDKLLSVNGAVPCRLELVFQTALACAPDAVEKARARLTAYKPEL